MYDRHCSDLVKLQLPRQPSVKNFRTDFHENLTNGLVANRAYWVTDGKTDGRVLNLLKPSSNFAYDQV
jgi:hypothetical protein